MNRFLLAAVVLGAGGCTRGMPAQVAATDSIMYRRSSGGWGPEFRQAALTLRGDGSVEYVTGGADHLGADGNMVLTRRLYRLDSAEVVAVFDAIEAAGLFDLKDEPPPPDAGGQGFSAHRGNRGVNATWAADQDRPVRRIVDSLITRWFPPEPTPPADSSAVGTIQGDCAPWDGAALAVALPMDSLGAGAQLLFSVWKSDHEAAEHRWFIGSEGESDGVGRLCATPNRCVNVRSGWVEFNDIRVGDNTEGGYRLSLEDGRLLVGRFLARWIERRVLCG